MKTEDIDFAGGITHAISYSATSTDSRGLKLKEPILKITLITEKGTTEQYIDSIDEYIEDLQEIKSRFNLK